MQIDKSLMAGSTTLLILSLLREGEKYGYEMIAELARRSDDTFQLKEGTLYPILYRLEDDGMIVATWSQGEGKTAPKKMYTATEKGRQERHRRRGIWQDFSRTVNGFYEEES